MDRENREHVKSHYNSHANAAPSFNKVWITAGFKGQITMRVINAIASWYVAWQAILDRRLSRAAPLKDFHGQIKKLMIKKYKNPGAS